MTKTYEQYRKELEAESIKRFGLSLEELIYGESDIQDAYQDDSSMDDFFDYYEVKFNLNREDKNIFGI